MKRPCKAARCNPLFSHCVWCVTKPAACCIIGAWAPHGVKPRSALTHELGPPWDCAMPVMRIVTATAK
eukprot:1161430-Pelagomonas_calceolata.AAC.9